MDLSWIFFSNYRSLAYNSRADFGLISEETGEPSQIGSEKMRSVMIANTGKGEERMCTAEEIQQGSFAPQVSSH